jgi:mono/diheme cytochrome c family protein
MEMNRFFTVTSIAVVVAAAGWFSKTSLAKEAKMDAMKVYNKNCGECHDKNGRPTDLGKGLESADFTDKNWQSNVSDEKIMKQIMEGSPDKMMPFKEKLNQDEIMALVPIIRGFAKK